MIRVLSRTVRVVVVLVGLGAGAVPLGCKLATKDNPDVCVSNDAADNCGPNRTCTADHRCVPLDAGAGGKAVAGTNGMAGGGGAGGRAALGSGGAGGSAGLGGPGGLDGGVADGPIDQSDPMDAPVDKPMCTATDTSMCPVGAPACSSEGKCVECTPSDNKCPAVNPVCSDKNACGKCSSELDCAARAGATHCDTSGGACVECTKSPECAANMTKPVCDTTNHVCVPCLASSDCPAASPICDTAMRKWVDGTLPPPPGFPYPDHPLARG